MDNTTQEPTEQAELSPEDAKAVLGLSTRINEQFMTQQAQQKQAEMASQAPQMSETAPQGEAESPEEDNGNQQKLADMEAKIDQKLEILRSELKDSQKLEIDSIKKDIKDALENEQD